MTAHTPGPWEAKHLDRFHLIIVEPNGGAVAKTQLTLPRTTVASDEAVQIEICANAQVMAAAPELLASLRECLGIARAAELQTTRPEVSDIVERAERAILKADPMSRENV